MQSRSRIRRTHRLGLCVFLLLLSLLAASRPALAQGSFPARPKLNVLYQEHPISQDQQISGGLVTPGTTKTVTFALHNESTLPLSLPANLITIDGEEMVVTTSAPTVLAPGETQSFTIEMMGIGSGDVIRTVTIQGPRQVYQTFRLRMTVLTAAAAEAAVLQAYERYQEFAAADYKDMTIGLTQFETLYPPELATTRYLDLFDYVQVETLKSAVLSRGSNLEGIVSYTPAWHDLAEDQVAADAARKQRMENWTFEDLLTYAQAHDFPIPEIIAATTFDVGLHFENRSRQYKAAFLWMGDDGVFVHDMVVKDLGRVRVERRLPVSRATVEHDEHPLPRRWQNGNFRLKNNAPPGSKRCHPWYWEETQLVESVLSGTQHHDISEDPDGRHFSEYRVNKVCKHETNCVNRCEIGPVEETCDDAGPLYLAPTGDVLTHVPFAIFGTVQETEKFDEATTCQERFGCGVARCLGGVCVEGITFKVPGLADIDTIPHNRPVYNLSQMELNTCVPPVECDPDATDNGGVPDVPGGFCEDAVGQGYRVTVDADLRGAHQDTVAFEGFVELSLITDPPISTDPLRITQSGVEYPFSERLPEGTRFHIGIADTSPDTDCGLNSNATYTIAGGDHRGLSHVICIQRDLPTTCPQNPTVCITPPDGCETVHTITQVEVDIWWPFDGTVTVDGQEIFLEGGDLVSTTIGVPGFGIRCHGNVGSTDFNKSGFNKSANTTWGPTIYSRNPPNEPVSGEVAIWGVARDDIHGVRDVEVYLDGQLAPLSQFDFNLRHSWTCSEFSTGEPCDDTSTFFGILDTTHLTPGQHEVVINATNTAGVPSVITTSILVAAAAQPDVRLKVSYLPENGDPRTAYDSQSADPQTPVRFRYDESQGTYHERSGGACDSGTNNPTYLSVRMDGDPDFRIDACQIRGSWDSQWYPCTQGLVDDINNRDYIVLATDSHLYAPCDFENPVAPHIGLGQPAWFKVRFIDNGLVYERRIDMVKAP